MQVIAKLIIYIKLYFTINNSFCQGKIVKYFSAEVTLAVAMENAAIKKKHKKRQSQTCETAFWLEVTLAIGILQIIISSPGVVKEIRVAFAFFKNYFYPYLNIGSIFFFFNFL